MKRIGDADGHEQTKLNSWRHSQRVCFDPSHESSATSLANESQLMSTGESPAHRSISGSVAFQSGKKQRQPEPLAQAHGAHGNQGLVRPPTNSSSWQKATKHPLDSANLISKLFFGWMFPLLWCAWRNGLKSADLPDRPSSSECCQEIGEKLVANWELELESCKEQPAASASHLKVEDQYDTRGACQSGAQAKSDSGNPISGQNQQANAKRPSLARVVIRTYLNRVLLNSLVTFFSEVVCKSLSAYSVGQMLWHIRQRELVDYSRLWSSEDPLVFWASMLVLAVCSWVISSHFYGFQMMRLSLHMRVGCSYLIYRKSLKLNQTESVQSTIGKMVNLLSNDLDKFNYVCLMVPFLWVGPIQTMVSLTLLWPILGPSCLGSILVLSLLIPLQMYLSRKFARLRRRIAACTDERVRLLSETMSSLRLIKLYGWEQPFRQFLGQSRRRETDLIGRVGIIKGFSAALMYISSKLVLFATIISHYLIFGGSLDARTLFMSMAMLNNVQFTMTQLMPRVASFGVESLVSLGRITDFLLSKEFTPSHRLTIGPVHKEVIRSWSSGEQVNSVQVPITTLYDNRKLVPKQIDLSRRLVFIESNNIKARWPTAETQTLNRISFKCQSPELVVVCGQVASGKTSLIMSLLNELPISEGQAKIQGSCGYCSQSAWIFNGTLRDNIVFGHGYKEQRYAQVVDICALRRDFDLLEFGDLTYISEELLSGGQKARINLARCLYRECDIYLLDDPFSAIDGRVSVHIFEKAIRKFLSDKLVLLTTYRASILSKADKILLLDHGNQLAYCSYNELYPMFYDTKCDILNPDQVKRLSFIGDSLKDHRDNTADQSNFGDNSKPENLCTEITRSSELLSEERNRSVKFCARNSNTLTSSSLENIYLKLQNDENQDTCPLYYNQDAHISRQNSSRNSNSISHDGHKFKSDGHSEQSHSSGDNLKTNQPSNVDYLDPYGQTKSSADHGVDALIMPQEASSVISAHVSNTIESNSRANPSPEAETKVEANEETSANKVDQEGNGDNSGETRGSTARFLAPSMVAHYRRPWMANLKAHDHRGESDFSQQTSSDSTNSKFPNARDEIERRNEPADEEMSSRKMAGISVWFKYYTQTSVIRLVLLIITFIVTQALLSTVDVYLTVWTLSEQNNALLSEITSSNQQQVAAIGYGTYSNIHSHNRNNVSDFLITYDLLDGGSASIEKLLPKSGCSQDCVDLIKDQIAKGSFTEINYDSPLSIWSSSRQIGTRPILLLIPKDSRLAAKVDFSLIAKTSWSTSGRLPADKDGGLVTFDGKQVNQITSLNQGESSPITNGSCTISNDENNLLALVVDRNMFEESEAALNVKSIYRPLYVIVNKFTSIHHIITYTLLLMVVFSSSAIANVLSLTSSNKSAVSLYNKLIDNALFAKLTFFDRNPVGRFLNRATRDIGIIDEAIPYNANQAYDALLQTAATFILVAAVDITLALPSLIILFIFLIFHSIHVKPAKDFQRLEGISRSPIITHVSTTLVGLHTIRATKSEHRFQQIFMRHQDAHTSAFLLYLGCYRATALVLDWLNATYTGVVAFWVVVSGLTGPSAGLIITSAMLLSGLTQHGLMKLTETESLMTSVERVIEYCGLPQEASAESKGKNVDGSNGRVKDEQRAANINTTIESSKWPTSGSLEYRNVDLYYNRSDKPVLKNISFNLSSGEKVGIIGRTGAGKSSIITTLFRLYDFDGTILIDGRDIKLVPLIELRTSIGIIPQKATLFSTTVRRNLDPLNIYDDFSLWAALDKAHLRETISALPGKLDFNIGNGCFSSGQKQLICLARVLLRQNSLIVMDEATANVDPNTDSIIQATIRREFKHCTVLTIAHRLETILDCDRIMVLDAGRIVEFDTPEHLAAKNNSHFVELLRKCSPSPE